MKMKYKVTTPFGCVEDGKIINCFVLCKDDDQNMFVVLHLPDKHGCGSIELCKLKGDYLVSVSDKTYCNLGTASKELKDLIKKLKKK